MVGYGVQLREKQKVKRIYGVLEDQFRRYFEQADRTRGGITGETLLQLLERRLDNVVYRMGLATSRAQARQLVRHGHFLVNGKRVDVPSYSLKSGDTVIIREGSRENPTILHAREEVKGRGIPEWISPEGDHGRQGRVDADARADQPARAGTADRRVVLEVSRDVRRSIACRAIAVASQPRSSSLSGLQRANVVINRRSGGRNCRPVSERKLEILWKGFQRPKRLEFERETLTDRFGRFYAQPFERGFGTTIGNALRRVLLSSIEGAAITAVQIDGVLHEFSPIKGVVEDATDIILNLKQLPLTLHVDYTKTLTLRKDKPGPVRASDIEADADVEILEPDAHIATIAEGGKLHMQLRVKRGRGYVAPTATSTRISASAGSRSTRSTRRSRRSTTRSKARASARPPTTTS